MSQEIMNRPLHIAVLTVSDTRTEETDKGGAKVQELIGTTEHIVKVRRIVKDDFDDIRAAISEWIHDRNVDVIISTGGTGIAKRDVTIEAVSSLYDKEIPGFGEIFRYLSYVEDIGTRAIASRATAGVAGRTLIFSVPGSVGAVTLAVEKLIIPEMAHLMREITK